jgi:hypothetical protein
VANVGVAEEKLRERHALQHGKLNAGPGESFPDALDFANAAEGFEGIQAGAVAEFLADEIRHAARTDAVERVEDKGTQAMVGCDSQKAVPVDGLVRSLPACGPGDEFADLVCFRRAQARPS